MEERNYKLYLHISPNGKRYYGITSMEPENRWKNGKGYRTQLYFYRAINKYGWDNFEHIVLFDNLAKEEACLLEQMYIALYNTTNSKYGYNNSLGGEHGLLSEKSKKKISEAQKGKHPTEETKKKMSEANKGKVPWNKGKPQTEEHIRKISEAKKGHETTEETKKKISEGNKGKKFTEETKKKMSEARKEKYIGKDNPSAKPVLMFTLDGEFIKRFDCVRDANEYLGKKRASTNINNCATGRADGQNRTAYGYIWIFEEDYIKEQEQAI